jgi:predicted RNA methylase
MWNPFIKTFLEACTVIFSRKQKEMYKDVRRN